MHPRVIQEGPGLCPLCRMELVPMEEQRQPGVVSLVFHSTAPGQKRNRFR